MWSTQNNRGIKFFSKCYFSSKEKFKENRPLGQSILRPFSIAPAIHICDYFCISLTIKGVRQKGSLQKMFKKFSKNLYDFGFFKGNKCQENQMQTTTTKNTYCVS